MNVQIEPDVAALDLLTRGDHHAAHLVLREAYDRNPEDVELARLANMIAPCRMLAEAQDGLRRRLTREAGPKRADLPFDPDMGRTQPVVVTQADHNRFPKGRW